MRLLELRGYVYPLVLTFQLIFGVLQLLDFFQVRYHPMIERRVAGRVFQLGFSLVVPLVALMVVWVAWSFLSGWWGQVFAAAPLFFCLYSVELGVAATSLLMCFVGVALTRDRGRFWNSLCWVLSFFLGLGVVHWGVLRPMGVPSPLGGVFSLVFNVHHVLRRLFPVLVLPFLFFWVVKPVVGLRWRLPEVAVGEGCVSRFSVVLLAFSLYISVYLALYPYFPSVNLSGVDFGVDVPNYVRMFEAVEAGGEGVMGFLGDTRTFFYLVLVLFRAVTGLDVHGAVRFLPVVLNPFFVGGSYYFCYEIFRNHGVASWCAFLSATGMMLTSAMSAYYLTNVLALGLVLFSLGLLWRALRGDVRALVGACVLGVFLVFTHPWTMDQYLSGLALLLGLVLYRREDGFRVVGLYLGVYFGAVGIAEACKSFFFRSLGGIEASSAVAVGLIGIDEVIGDALFAFPYVHSGALSNVVLVVLAAVAIYSYGMKDAPGRYLGFLVLLSSVVYFVSNQSRKMRLVVNLPFGLFGALIVYSMYNRRNFSFTVFCVAYSLFYVLVSVGNLIYY